MPRTSDLMEKPPIGAQEPYKIGTLFKRTKTRTFSAERQRIFIFKYHTLYWVSNKSDEKPRSSIKFDGRVIEVHRKTKAPKQIFLKTTTRELVLRSESQKEIDSWYHFLEKRVSEQNSLAESGYHSESKYFTDEEKLCCEDSRWYNNLDPSARKELVLAVQNSENLEKLGYTEQQANFVYARLGEDGEDNGAQLFYEFAFGFLRDVIYTAMLHSQREKLHNSCKKMYTKMEIKDSRWGKLVERSERCANR